MMVLHGFASRNPKNKVLRPKTLKYYKKLENHIKNPKNNPEIFQVNIGEACSQFVHQQVVIIGCV